jgi:hypothetical protein
MDEQEQREKEEALLEARRAKYQRRLDEWIEWQRAEEEYWRRRQRELDPFGWGHWN